MKGFNSSPEIGGLADLDVGHLAGARIGECARVVLADSDEIENA